MHMPTHNDPISTPPPAPPQPTPPSRNKIIRCSHVDYKLPIKVDSNCMLPQLDGLNMHMPTHNDPISTPPPDPPQSISDGPLYTAPVLPPAPAPTGKPSTNICTMSSIKLLVKTVPPNKIPKGTPFPWSLFVTPHRIDNQHRLISRPATQLEIINK